MRRPILSERVSLWTGSPVVGILHVPAASSSARSLFHHSLLILSSTLLSFSCFSVGLSHILFLTTSIVIHFSLISSEKRSFMAFTSSSLHDRRSLLKLVWDKLLVAVAGVLGCDTGCWFSLMMEVRLLAASIHASSFSAVDVLWPIRSARSWHGPHAPLSWSISEILWRKHVPPSLPSAMQHLWWLISVPIVTLVHSMTRKQTMTCRCPSAQDSALHLRYENKVGDNTTWAGPCVSAIL